MRKNGQNGSFLLKFIKKMRRPEFSRHHMAGSNIIRTSGRIYAISVTCTVITPAREVNRNESTRNMVASRVATDSSSPPVGYDTMPNDQQVRKWLDSFRGPIADQREGQVARWRHHAGCQVAPPPGLFLAQVVLLFL